MSEARSLAPATAPTQELAMLTTDGGALRPRPRFAALRSLWRRKLALGGALIVVAAVFVAVFAPLLTPHNPETINIVQRLQPPGWRAPDGALHVLGTDTLGRDVLARLAYGARVSLAVGLSAVFIAGSIGVLLGLISGYWGGVVDDVIMRIGDIQLAFPFILLAISVLAVLGPGVGKLIAVLGITGWVQYGRIVRSQVVSCREMEFVDAARSIGARNWRIILRHILPNVWSAVIVIASFSVASTIISEASLSFLGLGVPPQVPTWGGMLSESREYLEIAPWLVIFPGLAIALTVLGINVLGDWIRDYLDPRMKNLV